MVTEENVKVVFQFHAPDRVTATAMNVIGEAAEVLARVILSHTPVCADQQAAIRKVREAMMTAHAAIVTKGEA